MTGDRGTAFIYLGNFTELQNKHKNYAIFAFTRMRFLQSDGILYG
ncbi:hypothetical protein [Anabaena sp. CCY 9402-a]